MKYVKSSVLAFAMLAAPACAATVQVASLATLTKAVSAAKDGDVMALAGGAWPCIDIRNVRFGAAGVTFIAADPANPPAVAGINLQNDAGFTVRGLKVGVDPRQNVALNVGGGSDRIVLDGNLVDGGALTAAVGVNVRASTNVSVTGNEVTNVGVGVQHLDNSHVVISANHIHDVHGDGIKGGGTSFLTISGNVIDALHPQPGDHPDGIQLWTVNETASATDILISGNQIRRASGDPTQGIFVGNENNLPYLRLTITGNLVMSGMWHGISVYNAPGVTISGNWVQGQADAISGGQVMTPWIGVFDTAGATVTGNTMTGSMTTGSTGVFSTDNTTIQNAPAGDYTAATAWLTAKTGAVGASSPTEPVVDVAKLQADLATAQGQVADLTTQLAAAAAAQTASLATITQLRGQLATAQASLVADQAVLADIAKLLAPAA